MVTGLIAAAVIAASTTGPGAPTDDAARFKALVLEGERQFGQGEFGAAIWDFREADAIRITPEVAFNLAKAHQRIGDEAMAAYYYRLYLRRAPNASDALEVASTLGDILSRAEADGRGLLEVEASVPGEATVDGMHWPQLPVAVFLPPGDYDVEARFGMHGESRKVSVMTGRTFTLSLEPMPPPLLNSNGAEDALSMASSNNDNGATRHAVHVSSMVVMGASAAALVAGTVFGAVSAGNAGRLADKSTLTVTEARQIAQTANGTGTAANVLWSIGAAGAVVGGAMFVFTLPEPGEPQAGGTR